VSAKIAARRVDCAGLEIAGFEIGFHARQRSSCRRAARSGRSSISDVAKVRLANRRGSDHARSSLGPSLAGRRHQLEPEQTTIHRSICFELRVDEAIGDGP
jgi:hypothetical protein